MGRKPVYPSFSAGDFLVDVEIPNGLMIMDDFLDLEVGVIQTGRPQTRGNRLGKIRVRDLVRKFE